MGGFARTSPSYETPYKADDAMGKNGWGEGYTFPCLFRNGDKGWILISETGVDSKYCGSRLLGHENGLYTIGFPQEGEMNGNGTTAPGLALPEKRLGERSLWVKLWLRLLKRQFPLML